MSGRPDSFMPMFWGDYLKDTGHLTPAEHGAYLLLIAHYWTTGKPLPGSDDQLRRIARMDAAEWAAARPTLAGFFLDVAGQWTHKRIVAELEKAAERYAKRSEAGRRGNEKRWSGDREDVALRSQCDSREVPMRSQPQPQPQQDRKVGANAPTRARGALSDAHQAEFEEWWRHWPNRVGRKPAEQAFVKARAKASLGELVVGAQRYAALLKQPNAPNPKHPQGWLTDERWKDEVREHGQANGNAAGDSLSGALYRAAAGLGGAAGVGPGFRQTAPVDLDSS